METTTLYRPTGLRELALIFDRDFKRFPPRLPDQPIFYPVLHREYAVHIARDWNSPSSLSDFAGYVTRFEVATDYLGEFATKQVGARIHTEYWIPSERLIEFNDHIAGPIIVTDAFFGSEFSGFIPDQYGLHGKSAVDQFRALAYVFGYSSMDFVCETAANAKAVFLNSPFWWTRDFTEFGVSHESKIRVFEALATLWSERCPDIPFFSQSAGAK